VKVRVRMEDTAVREWKVRYPVSSRVARGVVEAIEKSTRRKARGVSMILYGALKQSISEDIAFSLTNLLSRISSQHVQFLEHNLLDCR